MRAGIEGIAAVEGILVQLNRRYQALLQGREADGSAAPTHQDLARAVAEEKENIAQHRQLQHAQCEELQRVQRELQALRHAKLTEDRTLLDALESLDGASKSLLDVQLSKVATASELLKATQACKSALAERTACATALEDSQTLLGSLRDELSLLKSEADHCSVEQQMMINRCTRVFEQKLQLEQEQCGVAERLSQSTEQCAQLNEQIAAHGAAAAETERQAVVLAERAEQCATELGIARDHQCQGEAELVALRTELERRRTDTAKTKTDIVIQRAYKVAAKAEYSKMAALKLDLEHELGALSLQGKEAFKDIDTTQRKIRQIKLDNADAENQLSTLQRELNKATTAKPAKAKAAAMVTPSRVPLGGRGPLNSSSSWLLSSDW